MADRRAATRQSKLSAGDRAVLARWARGSSRRAVRARIVLACDELDTGDTEVAAALGVSRPTVACWRRRFALSGLSGLADAGRCGRPKAVLELTGAERAQLTRWARLGATGQTLALRARIVLACAAGPSNKEAAAQLHVTEAMVARWRARFLADRLAGLADRRRPGRPPSITPQKAAQVITATQREPPGQAARWSRASMARETGLSPSTVGRIWSRSGLRPHQPGQPPIPAAPSAPPSTEVLEIGKKLITALSGAKLLGARPKTAQDERSSAGLALPDDQAGRTDHHAKAQGQALLAAERRDLLLTRLRLNGKLIAKDLADEFGLSEDSVRRDLRDLAAAGLCKRVYGGALPISPLLGSNQIQRSRLAPHSKQRVGARAAQLINPGDTVILDGGTTAVEVAKALPPDLEATIITHSVTTAAALADHPRVEVTMLSGWLDKKAVTSSGATTAEAARNITADLALLIMSAIHPHEGLTADDPEHAAMKRILASRATATYAMASSEKLGTALAYKITDLSEIAGIITDEPDHPTIRQLRDQGTIIIQAT